jgi:hypothetical protein
MEGGKMPLWKITESGPTKVAETSPKQEKLLEENLEVRKWGSGLGLSVQRRERDRSWGRDRVFYFSIS